MAETGQNIKHSTWSKNPVSVVRSVPFVQFKEVGVRAILLFRVSGKIRIERNCLNSPEKKQRGFVHSPEINNSSNNKSTVSFPPVTRFLVPPAPCTSSLMIVVLVSFA